MLKSLNMKKTLKTIGIVVFAVLALLITLGMLAENAEEKSVQLLTSDSLAYYSEVGTFENFCSSDFYIEIARDLEDKVTCSNDTENDGNGLQVVVKGTTSLWACKVANSPPVNGEPQKSVACIVLPETMRSSL